jgi:hypothetical protein
VKVLYGKASSSWRWVGLREHQKMWKVGSLHGRRHAEALRKSKGMRPPNDPPSPAENTNLPRFLVLSQPHGNVEPVMLAAGWQVAHERCHHQHRDRLIRW